MRKFVLVAVIAVAVLAAAGTVAAQSSQRFEDVPPDAYYYEPVEWAFANGITGGCTATEFCPHDTLTRAHAVTFLYRAIAPAFEASGLGSGDVIATDSVRLEPGYYTVIAATDTAPGFDWENPDDLRDFYVWFGSKTGGWDIINVSDNWPPTAFVDVRIDTADDYWLSIEIDDDFVWWADIVERQMPDGVTFD